MAKRAIRRTAAPKAAASPRHRRKVIAERGRAFTAVIERDIETGLLVGYVPGFPGAHSQGATVEELADNLQEVVAMLLEDGEPRLDAEFVGTQQLQVR
jgi:predicted RNase H-like HicB family nuclease